MTEIEKYKGIYSSAAHAHYGHSNHGHEALDLVTPHRPQRVLDVGCGYGEWGKELKACLPDVEVIGVDFACPGADMILDFTEGLPFPDKSFDFVTAFDVMEHLRPAQVERGLRELARVSTHFVFSIAYRPSVNLWQGENLHPTVQPEVWWVKQIRAAGGHLITTPRGFIQGCWKFETASEPRELRSLGKRWVLVGNGPSVLDAQRGEVIDAFDVVVRYNNYVTRGFERYTGQRTDLWAFAGNGMRPEGPLPPGLSSHGTPDCELPHTWHIPRTYYNAMRDELRSVTCNTALLPSCGYLTARYLIDTGATDHLSLIGFDHFSRARSGQHHYWQPGTFKMPVEHDGTAEAGLLLQHYPEQITYLNDEPA